MPLHLKLLSAGPLTRHFPLPTIEPWNTIRRKPELTHQQIMHLLQDGYKVRVPRNLHTESLFVSCSSLLVCIIWLSLVCHTCTKLHLTFISTSSDLISSFGLELKSFIAICDQTTNNKLFSTFRLNYMQ